MLELRVGALLVLGSYLFCGVATVLASFHINVYRAFGFKDTAQQIPYRFAHTMLATWATGAMVFAAQRLCFPGLETRFVLLVTLTCLLILIFTRDRLRGILGRIWYGGISAEHRLGDILVSDALVSMATLLVDVIYSFSLTFNRIPAFEPVNRPSHVGFKTLLIACVPQGIRMKQCYVDYRRTGNKQHLLNLGKYLIANTPHAMRIQMAMLDNEIPEEAVVREAIAKHVFKALVLNATCGYAWDILVDWRLGRLQNQQTKQNLRFPVFWYYAAAVVDLILRFMFLFAYDAEHIVFALQTLEILRRGMWCIFRTESEPTEFTETVELQIQ